MSQINVSKVDLTDNRGSETKQGRCKHVLTKNGGVSWFRIFDNSDPPLEGISSPVGRSLWYPSLCWALIAGFSATLSEYSAHMKVRMKENASWNLNISVIISLYSVSEGIGDQPRQLSWPPWARPEPEMLVYRSSTKSGISLVSPYPKSWWASSHNVSARSYPIPN